MWLIACSGPGAMAAIEAAERRGWIFFAIAAAIVVAFALAVPRIRRRSLVRHLDLVLLLLIQPGLWWSARHGDCGRLLREAAPYFAVLAAVGCGLIYLLARRRDRRAMDPTRL